MPKKVQPACGSALKPISAATGALSKLPGSLQSAKRRFTCAFTRTKPNAAACTSTLEAKRLGLTKYFAFYNTVRPHQSLDNQTPQDVHKTSSVGGAMIVNKYRSQERLPVALCSIGTAAGDVMIEIEPAIQKAKKKTGAAPSSCEKMSAT